jgi:hypothetical protein
VRDPGGRLILEEYRRMEEERRKRITAHLEKQGVAVPPGPGTWLRRAGAIYGRATSLLGTRVMLRIALSSGERASRRACAAIGPADRPDLIYLATLRAKSAGDLVDSLRQHLIDTRRR